MSKENVQNEVKTEVTTAEKLPEGNPVEKTGFVKRTIDAAKRTIIKVRRSKAGRVALTVVELGGIGYAGYKLGFSHGTKAALPAEVTIEGGEIEDVNIEEEPAENEVIEGHD